MTYRIALANVRFRTRHRPGGERPRGYRGMGKGPRPPDGGFLEHAWYAVGEAAANGNIAVILGTERIVEWRAPRKRSAGSRAAVPRSSFTRTFTPPKTAVLLLRVSPIRPARRNAKE